MKKIMIFTSILLSCVIQSEQLSPINNALLNSPMKNHLFSACCLSLSTELPDDEIQEEYQSFLPASIKHALKQLYILLKKNESVSFITSPLITPLHESINKELIYQILQNALLLIDELAEKDNNETYSTMLEYIKKTITDYCGFLLQEISDEDKATYRVRPYHTPALFNGPVIITSSGPQGALTVNGVANLTEVNINKITVDTLNVKQETIENLTVSNSLLLSYLANNAGKYLYLQDNLGTVQATSAAPGGIVEIMAGNNINVDIGTYGANSPVVSVAGTTPYTVQTGSPNNALHSLPSGTNGQVLVSQGAGIYPQWQSIGTAGGVTSVNGGAGINISGTASSPVVNLISPVAVIHGGTGRSTIPAHNIMIGEDTASFNFAAPGAQGTALISQGASLDPIFGIVPVSGGGTGQNTFTPHSVLIGEGTANIVGVGPGEAGQLLLAAGSAIDPSFVSPTAGTGLSLNNNASTLEYSLDVPVSIAHGGTNATSMANTDGVIYFDGTKLDTTNVGNVGDILTSNGGSNPPSFQSISAAGAVTSVNAGNNISIAGTATSPIVNVSGTTTNAVQIGNALGALTSISVGSNGQVLLGATSTAPAFGSLTSTAGTVTYTTGPNALNIDLTIPVTIAHGGTNATSMSNTDGVIYYDGTKLATTNAGTAGQILTSTGAGAPSFQNPAASSITITGDTGGPLTGNSFTFTGGATGLTFNGAGTTESLSGILGIANGGTNTTNFSSPFGIVYYNGTKLATTNAGTSASVLTANGASSPSFTPFSSSNTPNTLVYRDASGNFSSNIITANTLNANPTSGNAITVNGNKFVVDYQGNADINGNVTLTHSSATLQLPAGNTSAPSLNFTGSTTTGLSASSGNLSFSTNGAESMKISSAGTVSIDQFTTAGVIHNDASGNLSSSLIVNGDISSSAAITDNKLATISTPGKVANSATTATSSNTPSTIVARDSSGNFSAGTITASLAGHASLDVLKAGDTMTGTLTLPAGSSAIPSLQFTGSADTGLAAPTTNTLSFSTNGSEAMNINGSGQITIDGFSAAGVVHNNASGLLSTSLIVDADITTATITNDKLANISSSDIPGDIVVRDGSGNFTTNMINIDGTPSANNNVATVAYVNSVTGTGIVVHPPAEVVAVSNYSPEGEQTIDGVTLASGDRVLLQSQTNPIENGLWVAAVGALSPWYRPTDFANGSPAGSAYVLITEGTNYAGSSWLCSTPKAIIGSSPIYFEQFSLPNQVTGANVGAGAGQIFQSKSGITLNFRTITGDSYLTASTSPTEVTISSHASPSNIPSTIVARDGSGNFAAGDITVAGLTVNGDALITGTTTLQNTLNLDLQSEIDLHDLNTTNYVGLKAPATVNSSYTLLLPSSPPLANQILQSGAVTPTQLEWIAKAGNISPSTSRTIYVTEYGNDITGNGSFEYPYASLAKAVNVANAISTQTDPVVIAISPGTYTENNSAGPITVTAGGISIIGDAANSTFIAPTTLSQDLIAVNPATPQTGVRFRELTFVSGGVSTASGVSLSGTGNTSSFAFVQIVSFNTGISCDGTDSNYLLNNCILIGNNTALTINDNAILCSDCIIVGSSYTTPTPANTGISATGSSAEVTFADGTIQNCATGIILSNNANISLKGTDFTNNNNPLVQNSAAKAQCLACSFTTNPTSGISIQASGSGTLTDILGCYFNGLDLSGSPQGSAIQITNQAIAALSSSQILNYLTGIQLGSPTDTASTSINVSSTDIENITTDIIQNGSTKLVFNGTANSAKISINDSTNVELNYFNREDNSLTIGKSSNVNTPLITVAAFPTNNPQMVYNPSIYSTQAMGYEDLQASPTSIFVLSDSDTNFIAVTNDRTKVTGLRLLSDTSLIVGGPNGAGVRGWEINKSPSTAQLTFSYQNSDSGDGQALIPEYILMQLDGVNNQVQFPTTSLTSPTEIIFGGDTSLYRSAANTLTLNNNLIVNGSLTATSLPAHSVLLGEGANPISSTGPGTAGQLLIAAGASADPAFITPTAGIGLTLTSNASTLQYALSSPVSILHGGTNTSSFSSPDGVIYYDGTKLSTTNIGSAGQILTSNGAGNAPTFQPISATGAITQIDGNSGSVTGSTVTIEGGNNIITSGTGSTLTVNVVGTTANALQVGSPNGALKSLPLGTNGQVLLGSTGTVPSFVTPTAGTGLSLTSNASTLQYALSVPISVSNGGTGATNLTQYNVLLGNGTSAIATAAPSATAGIPLVSNGSSANPSFGTALVAGGGTGATSFSTNSLVISGATGTSALSSLTLTNGQLPIGRTGTTPVAAALTAGTGIAITNGSGSITIASSGEVPTTFTENTGSATPSANNINIFGSPTQGLTTSGSGATVSLNPLNASSTQKGVASFNSSNFTVTSGAVSSNNFTITAGTGLTGGGSLTLGGSTTISLSTPVSVSNGGTGATTLTGVLIGNGTSAITGNPITQYDVLVGGVSNAIASIAPSATAGVPLISNGSTANPSFGTATVAGGGTGATSFTAYAPLTGGTTTTGALQSASTGQSNSGYVFTSNGSSALPSFSSLASLGAVTSVTGDAGSAVTPTSGVITFNANTNAGATVKFSGAVSTMSLLTTDPTLFNTFIGLGAGTTSATGTHNTSLGYQSLHAITSGGSNVAIGYQAGSTLTTGSNDIYIGSAAGSAAEANTIRIGTVGTQTACYIAGISGVAVGTSSAVRVSNTTGQLGTTTSSRRYKENIVPLDSVSTQLTQLEPVQFTYKVDNGEHPQYGLIAEDVYEIYPEWILYNREGKIESVNYDFLPPVLLKGWQEQQEIIKEQHDKIAKQQQQIDDLYAQIITMKSALDELHQASA